MLQSSADNLEAFSVLFPDIAREELPAAYDRFVWYVQLATAVSSAQSRAELTNGVSGGTVLPGTVDPRRTFTNTG
jgi:hypothetical protein